MNRLVSVALAGAVALSAVGVSTTGASAGDRWHHPYDGRGYAPRYDRGPRNDVGPALVAGAIFGLAVGSLMQPDYPDYPAYPAYAPPPPRPDYGAYASDAHFQWCASTYETYNGETDTWIDYRGVPHRCISP